MRKFLFCVLMISTLTLTSCGGGGDNRVEEQALAVRARYLEMTTCKTEARITADYGQRVYSYDLSAQMDGEELVLTLTAPETVAGITAHLKGKNGFLEYDDLFVETGPLDESGLTPVAAIPALLEAARSGYMAACSITEEGLLRVDCRDPEKEPETGRTVTLWFDPNSGGLIGGEISNNGFRVISCEFTNFIME